MRSKELAEFAGVTVRALRHYHSLGILPEPPRGENGYRKYSAADAVTVLRIKRLSATGFSLSQIKDMFEAEQTATDDTITAGTSTAGELISHTPAANIRALKELEASLTNEIERLEQQRKPQAHETIRELGRRSPSLFDHDATS